MRRQIVHSLLASLLLIQSVLPCAFAQTGEGQTANDRLPARENLLMRSPDTQHEEMPRFSGDVQTLSVIARHTLVTSAPRYFRYPRPGSSSGMWRQPGNRRHALIGALIGFGLGAALGATVNKDEHTRARIGAPILFGAIGASIGAAIGGSHP
jgi:hypothetical protein